jgi:hypothetical protein
MYLNMDKENPSCLRAYLNSNPALNPNYHYYLTMYAIDYLIASYFTMYNGDETFWENDQSIQRKQVWKLSAF